MMARIYDIVCTKCGEIQAWCKYDDLPYECDGCHDEMKSEDWEVFGVWSTSDDVRRFSKKVKEEVAGT